MRLGKGTAAQIARVTDVPRNKLYPVMQQLNQLGIVETALGEAQVFRPLPVDRFLGERLETMRAQVEALEASRDTLGALFGPVAHDGEASPEGYRVFHGRANTAAQLRDALRGARAEVHLVLSPGSPRRMLASGEAELLRERLDEGVLARVVAPRLPGQEAPFEELAEVLGPSLRALPGPTPPCVVLGVDGSLFVQAQVQPDDGSTNRGSDVCLVSASTILAAVAAHHAVALWDLAGSLRERGVARAGPEVPSHGAP